MIREMNGVRETVAGDRFPRLQMKAYNLEDEDEYALFMKNDATSVVIPRTNREAVYTSSRKIGVAVSKLGTSRAIALGSYHLMLDALKLNESL